MRTRLYTTQVLLLTLMGSTLGDCGCGQPTSRSRNNPSREKSSPKLTPPPTKPVPPETQPVGPLHKPEPTKAKGRIVINRSNYTDIQTCPFLTYFEVMETASKYPKKGKMALIKGGDFIMGNNDEEMYFLDGENPERQVFLNDFYMDQTEVTNEQFAAFVHDTGYVTSAEQFNDSMVFNLQVTEQVRNSKEYYPIEVAPWWYVVSGASWKTPRGPGSYWEEIPDHPVVHVSWDDAVEYCKWAGKRLPTEAEWEYACRAGKKGKDFPWGNKLTPTGIHMMNNWQGRFPLENTAEDGYQWTAPVGTYQPSNYDLFDMTGNVWEWVEDWFTMDHPKGPLYNPRGPDHGGEKTKKGGSYMCHHTYCHRYRCSGRYYNTPDSGASNMGFRCARTPTVRADNEKNDRHLKYDLLRAPAASDTP